MSKLPSMVLVSIFAFAGAAIAAPMPRLPVADKSWEKVADDDAVLVHRKEVPNSDIVAFRGETVIDAPVGKVAGVLIDTPRKLEWVAKIIEAKDVRAISEYERIEYNATSSGFFLVKDRDFVFRAKGVFDKANRRMTISLKSEEDPAMPATGRVRGQLDESRYILTSLDGGKKTHVVVEIHADPRGSVPKWLVNLFQKSWPAKTLNGIRAQCAKPDVKEDPGVKAFFAERG